MTPERMSRALRELPRQEPPEELRTALRVLASRDRERRRVRQNWRTFLSFWLERADVYWSHALRATALPAAGGLAAALALFVTVVVPAYPLRVAGSVDVPTMLSTEVGVKSMSAFSAPEAGDVVVDVRVDEAGRMVDYKVIAGSAVVTNHDLRRRLESTLLYSVFTPATTFGRPTSSRVRLWFRSSEIEVRG